MKALDTWYGVIERTQMLFARALLSTSKKLESPEDLCHLLGRINGNTGARKNSQLLHPIHALH